MPGLMGRTITIIKAKFSKLLDRAENPERDARLLLRGAAPPAPERQARHRRRRRRRRSGSSSSTPRCSSRSTSSTARRGRRCRRTARTSRARRSPARRRCRRSSRGSCSRASSSRPSSRSCRGREDAADEDRGLPHAEGSDQGAVLGRRGAGADRRGRDRDRRADGRRRPGGPAREGQDRADAGPRDAIDELTDGGRARGLHLVGRRHRPPAGADLAGRPGRRRAREDEGRARHGRRGAAEGAPGAGEEEATKT